MKYRIFVFYLSTLLIVGCSSKNYSNLNIEDKFNPTKISFLKRNNVPLLVTRNPEKIKKVTAFIQSNKNGWYDPGYRTPAPLLHVACGEFPLRGFSLGMGKDFLEVRIGGIFFIKNVAERMIRNFLEEFNFDFSDFDKSNSTEDKIMKVATNKVPWIKYEELDLVAVFDDNNEGWNSYVKSVEGLKGVRKLSKIYPFLKNKNLQPVYFRPDKLVMDGDSWVFVDKRTLEIAGIISGG